MEELNANGIDDTHIIYINLEDMDYEYIENASDLNKEIKSRIRDDEKYYLFLDKIQHVTNFEKALASFRATLNTSLFVTGSNSTLLSGELATLLTGRTVEFEVLPFSFWELKEYLELNNKPFTEDMFYDYLKWGGFPLRFDYVDETATRRYLENLYESIVNRDIVKKSRNIDKKLFMDISLYILANAGKEFSADNICDYYKKQNNKEVARRTVYNYLDKMKKAYLIHAVSKYNIVGKAALKIGAYDKITDASPKYVLSLDKLDMSQNGIIHMNILDFLLHKKDLILT